MDDGVAKQGKFRLKTRLAAAGDCGRIARMRRATLVLPFASLALLAADEPRFDWSTADLSFMGGPGGFEDSRALCRRVINAEPPASDRPTAAEASALEGCDSEALLYGIGRPADPVAARKCAFTEKDDEVGHFGGRQLLMTIYATGRGATRNLDVASHLACGIESAPAEMSRVLRIQTLKPGEDFSICDDITSGYMMGHCAAHGERVQSAKRDAVVAAIATRRGFADAADWASLTELLNDYVDLHGSDAQDMRGTARAAIAIGAESQERDNFVDALQRLDAGTIPSASSASATKSDAALNRAWKQVMGEITADDGYAAPTKAGMRGAGRKWIAYRDAMLAFAAKRFPGTPRTALFKYLTDQRTKALIGAAE
jgi:uncharacterized protein YecT (DUF1311 family)